MSNFATPAFDIPSLIPPLPTSSTATSRENNGSLSSQQHGKTKDADRKEIQFSSSALPSSHDKDNSAPVEIVNSGTKNHAPLVKNSSEQSNNILFQKRPPTPATPSAIGLGLRTPQTSASRLHGSASRRSQASPSPGGSHLRSSGAKLSSTTSNSGSTTKGKRRSVLRFGESVEFLFCITRQSLQEHRHIAKQIADGTLADCPKAWRQVLQMTSDLKTTNGTDLIRLHRRATLRFPLDQSSLSSSSSPQTLSNEKAHQEDILAIWLSFAIVHAKLGMIDEARRTYKYMENQNIPLGASFYLAISQMELAYDAKRAREILCRGITEQASPVEDIQSALDKLKSQYPDETEKEAATKPSIPTLSPRKRKIEGAGSPKRQKIEFGFVERLPDKNDSSTKRPPKALPTSKTKTSSGSVGLSSKNNTSFPMRRSEQKSSVLRARSSRLTPRLNPKGLSGKAKRVEAENSIVEDSESEQESHAGDTDTGLQIMESSNSASQCSSKIKKLDLSYMWEWDPSARGKTQEFLKSKKEPTMEKIDEGSTSSGQITHNSSSQASHQSGQTTLATTSTSSTPKQENHKNDQADVIKTSPPMVESVQQDERKACDESQSSAIVMEQQKSAPHKSDVLSNTNKEFLPLVHENNILRVNGSAYAKLGVIGKGGSCKVYRALSKKCAVVAIKKVKLDGIDKKAIEGYANEISLLKRLRGNPAIIQMYDAEVDISRKSIFVVMELGEADLSHILQQRALSGQSRSLNMNFIRLTWQQMLSAVHSIHEERIIHSDLKPANFLFVRGALKLIDFGIAKAIQSDDTTNIYRESHIGTLNYMSPEAILDTETGTNGPRMRIGRASDVWSLGCILYEMVHGKTPFAKLHFIQKLQAIVNPNYKIEVSDDVDSTAADVIRLCLQRNPDKRPPIVGDNGLLNKHCFLNSSHTKKR